MIEGVLYERRFDDPMAEQEAAMTTHPRFEVTESGISRRSFAGQPGGIHWLTGDEHTEIGHITEDPHSHGSFMEKRFRKLRRLPKKFPSIGSLSCMELKMPM
ncbi:MAG: hypothetical protein U0003_01205 [Vampirovibrionales bacterium]